MITFLQELNKLMTSIFPESFFMMNHKKKEDIVYPYLTYTYSTTGEETFSEDFILDVDVFDDQGRSAVRIESICWNVKKALREKMILHDDFLMRVSFIRQNPIPTGSDRLQRRNMQFKIKVDWRI